MDYYKNLIEKPLERPKTDILISENDNVTSKKVKLELNYRSTSAGLFNRYNVMITGESGNVQYKGKTKSSHAYVYDQNNNPLLHIKDTNLRISKKLIFQGRRNHYPIAEIFTRLYTTYKGSCYKLVYIDPETKKQEFLEISSDPKHTICCIFHGQESNGDPVICKIIRKNLNTSACTIEIAEGVDEALMVGLAIFFSNKVDYYHKDGDFLSDDNDYINVFDLRERKNKYSTRHSFSNNYNYYGYGHNYCSDGGGCDGGGCDGGGCDGGWGDCSGGDCGGGDCGGGDCGGGDCGGGD